MGMKLIIVEDEPRVRRGLAEIVDWASFELELVGTADNGLEGLELFKQEQPDLVVTDIRMPVMDGLAMTEAILEINPDTKIIIISGHDEFEYAQRCISLGVTNYLIKPIGKKQFHYELEKLMKEWKQDQEKRKKTQLFEHKLKSHLPMLRNAFLEEWLTGTKQKSISMLQESFSFLGITLDLDNIAALAVFELDFEEGNKYSHSDHRILEFAMNNIIEELLQDNGLAFQRGNGQTVVIFQTISSENAHDLYIWSERVKRKISSMLEVSVTVGMANRSVPIVELPLVFQKALHMLRLKLSLGTDMILHENLLVPRQEQIPVISDSDQALLIYAVEAHNQQEIRSIVYEWFQRWKNNERNTYPDEISFFLVGIYTNLAHRLGKSVRELLSFEDMKLWKNPEEFRSLNHMKNWWIDQFISLSQGYEGLRADRKTKIIQQVMKYVEEHIYENITRDDAAEHVYLNSSYLSRMFKEVTGESFSEFVMTKKMEKAIHLLQVEGIMVYEVADRLGYKDPSYFARVFKRFTGKSPSEFQ